MHVYHFVAMFLLKNVIVYILFYILQIIILHLDPNYVHMLYSIDIEHCCCILFDLSEMTK